MGLRYARAYSSIRAAACGGHARSGPAGCRPSPGEAAPARPLQGRNLKFRMMDRGAACEATARADASCGPSRGEAAARCGFFPKPQIHDSKFKIKWIREHARAYSSIRAAVCGGHARADLRDESCGPPPGGGCGPHGLCKDDFYPMPPPRPNRDSFADRPARSRADGLATRRSSPPPGGGCGLPVAARPLLQTNISTKTGDCGLLRCGRH